MVFMGPLSVGSVLVRNVSRDIPHQHVAHVPVRQYHVLFLLQGYLARKKHPPPRTLQQDYT